ncbi:thioredoxin family protein [Candidatus Babeliales bacterium]|nr:thioredoxin family protein [Candidatus Babeliales bacterium]
MKKQHPILLMLVTIYLLSNPLYPVTSISSVSSFYKKINKSDLVIAHFYFKDKNVRRNKDLYKKYKSDKSVFNATDDVQDFVKFIKINVSEEKFNELINRYNAKTNALSSVFLLFKNGKLQGQKYFNVGSVTIGKLQDFILAHFQTEIDKKTTERKKLERLRQRAWLLRRPYYGTYFYFGPQHTRYYYCPYHFGYHPYWYSCPHRYRHYHRGRDSKFYIRFGF